MEKCVEVSQRIISLIKHMVMFHDIHVKLMMKIIFTTTTLQYEYYPTLDIQYNMLYYHSNLPPPIIAPDGYIPNSIVWSQLLAWGMEPGIPPDKDVLAKPWQPMQLSEEQLAALRGMKQGGDGADEDMIAVGDMSMLDEAAEETQDQSSQPDSPKVDRGKSRQRQRNVGLKNFKELDPRAPPPEKPPVVAHKPPPEIPPEEVIKPPTPPPVVIVELPPPPLPRFISQFRGEEWFETNFKRVTAHSFDFLRRPPMNLGDAPNQVLVDDFVLFLGGMLPRKIGNHESAMGPGLTHRCPENLDEGVLLAILAVTSSSVVSVQEELIKSMVLKINSLVSFGGCVKSCVLCIVLSCYGCCASVYVNFLLLPKPKKKCFFFTNQTESERRHKGPSAQPRPPLLENPAFLQLARRVCCHACQCDRQPRRVCGVDAVGVFGNFGHR